MVHIIFFNQIIIILLLISPTFDFQFLNPIISILRLWGRNKACGGGIKAQYFAFAAEYFPIFGYGAVFSNFRLWGRIKACGGGIKAQYFAFIATLFPFYSYGTARRPAGASLKPGILHLQPSIFQFSAMGSH